MGKYTRQEQELVEQMDKATTADEVSRIWKAMGATAFTRKEAEEQAARRKRILARRSS